MIRKFGFKEGIFATMVTEKGSILIKLHYEKAPLTVANFIGLAQGIIPNDFKPKGVPFYDGLKFYRVVKGNMVISGCPKGDGSGHPGYLFKDEFHPDLKHNKPGILSMENYGPTTNGSQFNITLKEFPELDDVKPIFGEVVDGIDVLYKLQQGDLILKVEIMKVGKKAEHFDPLKVFEDNGFANMIKR